MAIDGVPMMNIAPIFSASSSEPIHGVASAEVWCAGLPAQQLTTPGAIIAVHLAGLGGVSQTFGRNTGKIIHHGVLTRAHATLPAGSVLLLNAANMIFIWALHADEEYAVSLREHLRHSICATPIELPNGELIYPRLIFAHLLVTGPVDANLAFQQTERALTQSPEFLAPPQAMSQSLPANEAFDNRLNALRLFGRKEIMERVVSHLQLPAPHPATVIICGPHQVGKDRLLHEVDELLHKHHLPLAHHSCVARDSLVPGTLLTKILQQFLAAFPPGVLRPRLAALLLRYPWLAARFSGLGERDAIVRPANIDELTAGLHELLRALAHMLPHIAIVDELQHADELSLLELAALQQRKDHALRLVVSVEHPEEQLPPAFREFLHTKPLVIRLPWYTRAQVKEYLHCFSATLATEEVLEELYQSSQGAPLALEEMLTTWLHEGKLQYQHNQWKAIPAEPVLTPRWDNKPTIPEEVDLSPVTADLLAPKEMERRVNILLAIRMLGLHLRLYPNNSSMVMNSLHKTQQLLDELPDFYAKILISYDGGELAIDGHPLSQRDLQLPLQEIRNWFQYGHIGELQLLRGITSTELTLCLHTLAGYDDTSERPLIEILRELPLPHVRCLSLHEITHPMQSKPGGSATLL